jgi:glycosyltransferase involved in cell wall biosynthesis
MKKIVNVAELSGKKWNFIERFYPVDTKMDLHWKYYSGVASNIIERFFTRPKLSRYRACLQANLALSSPDDIVISHMPRTTLWQSIFMSLLGKKQRHLAFSFNFTHLPRGKTHQAMIKYFKKVDRFVVFSNFERKRYREYFDIPIEKIDMLHWAMETPKINNDFITPIDNYYCAVGGEGRDYPTLIETFKQLPKQHLIIVTRPNTLDGIEIPPNVFVFYNLPSEKFWAIVDGSKAVIVPLINDTTACGHITLVGAMKLGKAIITTFSEGTTDYIVHKQNGLVVPPRDISALHNAISSLENNPSFVEGLAKNNKIFTEQFCDPSTWAQYIKQYIEH